MDFTITSQQKNRETAKLLENSKNEIQSLAKIQRKIDVIENYKKGNIIPLRILKDISVNMPQGVYVRQFNYDSTEKKILIKARTSSYALATKTAGLLSRSLYLKNIANKGSYLVKVTDKELVDFEVTADINGHE